MDPTSVGSGFFAVGNGSDPAAGVGDSGRSSVAQPIDVESTGGEQSSLMTGNELLQVKANGSVKLLSGLPTGTDLDAEP